MANSIIEGKKFESQARGGKDFDSQVDFMMFNGLKRRMNEIIIFFEQREEEEDGDEERDDDWIYIVAGFGKRSSTDGDSSRDKDGTDQNTSVLIG